MCPNRGVYYEGKYRADLSLPLSYIMRIVFTSYIHIIYYSDYLQLYSVCISRHAESGMAHTERCRCVCVCL